MALIKAIIEAINCLEPGKPINHTTFAKRFNIKYLMLSRRHRGVTSLKANQYKQQQILTNQHKKELINYINKLTN
jgi:hypothetical protein